MVTYPLSDRQFENLRAVFGRGVKKTKRVSFALQSSRFCEYFGRQILGLSDYGMVKIRFIPPRPNWVLYAFFCPGQSMIKSFVSGGQSTPITLFYAFDGHRKWITFRTYYYTREGGDGEECYSYHYIF